jgi:putative ABC transport system permease protein
VVVLTLGIGICFSTTMFSFLSYLILRPFPYRDPDRMVRLFAINPELGTRQTNLAPRDLIDLREQSETLAGISLAAPETAIWTGAGNPVQVNMGITFASFFSLLGAEPPIGRGFHPEDEKAGAAGVAVLSHHFWRRQFAGDRSILGRTLTLDGKSYTVIGVAPPNFEHPILTTDREPDLWVPMRIDLADMPRGPRWAQAVARLKPGVSINAVQAELATISNRLALENPESNKGWLMYVRPLQDSETRGMRPVILMLLSTAGMLLLIACFNVANLLLASGLLRQRELAVRTSVGADRSRLVRQLVLESMVLTGLGGLLGLALTPFVITALARLGPPGFLRLSQVSVDGKVLAFSLLLTLLTGLLFGLLPALRLSNVNLLAVLKDGGDKGMTAGSARLRTFLVVLQLAFSIVLLVCGGLLARSLLHLLQTDPGLDPKNLVTMQVTASEQLYPADFQVKNLYGEILTRVRAIPGIQSAGVVNALPFTSRYSCMGLRFADRPEAAPGEEPCAHLGIVQGDYFQTMRIRLIRGRLLTPQDDSLSPAAVVVNQTMAQQSWPKADPIGQQIRWVSEGPDAPWHTVVGVIGDVRHRGLGAEPIPETYVAYPHDEVTGGAQRTMMLVARASSSSAAAIQSLRATLASIDRNLPVADVQMMQDRIAKTLVLQRLGTQSAVLFSIIALLLAVLGVFGIISYLTNRRRHEFVIRIALGAAPADILRLVLVQGLRLAAIGLGVGFVLAFAVGNLMKGLLVGVSAGDPPVFLFVAVVVTAIALLATYFPARRASRIEAAAGLRS